MRQIFFDTETTGLSAEQGDRVIEIGCVELLNRQPTGRTFHHYVNPGRSSHPDALRVHGITDEFLADKPAFDAIAREFAEFIAGAELIAHNATFDVGFLDAEFRRVGMPRVHEQAAQVTDSWAMARETYPGKANSLDALCRRLEVDNTNRTFHGALLDANLLAEVYIRMTRGQGALVIDADDDVALGADAVGASDLLQYELVVIAPSADELAAHEAVLAALDKAAGGQAVWRALAPPTAMREHHADTQGPGG